MRKGNLPLASIELGTYVYVLTWSFGHMSQSTWGDNSPSSPYICRLVWNDDEIVQLNFWVRRSLLLLIELTYSRPVQNNGKAHQRLCMIDWIDWDFGHCQTT